MVRTKQTVRKSTGGKPPDPRLGQFFKDMWKAGETSLNNVMDRGDESPIAARSEVEELKVQDMEQDADPNAHPGDEVEAASDDEDGLEPSDMQHMIVTCAFVVPRPRRIDADDVFEYLTKFEEEKRSGKQKTTTPRTGNNKKKPRPVEAIADLLPFSQKDSSPIVLETYAKTHKLKWSEDLTLVRALIADPDVVRRAQQMRTVLKLLIETHPHEDPHRDASRRGSSWGRVPMRIFVRTRPHEEPLQGRVPMRILFGTRLLEDPLRDASP
ncbi:hypothetical protein R1sor_005025 [Riccia sorocarpa]|uniref:Uncharacterized protein n=1 Tax=Riccia sorocarpa TaxID=122646 RepID=A0ABD3HM70_9MARC